MAKKILYTTLQFLCVLFCKSDETQDNMIYHHSSLLSCVTDWQASQS